MPKKIIPLIQRLQYRQFIYLKISTILLVLVFSFYFFSDVYSQSSVYYLNIRSEEEAIGRLMVLMITFIFRIIAAMFCSSRARELNRSSVGWGTFGFFTPILAVIVILFMKPRLTFDAMNNKK